jgi:hypothetical protein|tara:strand:- start:28755 stop:29102 length:348 start_codon:yes stop_codon:yes gene_type:complete
MTVNITVEELDIRRTYLCKNLDLFTLFFLKEKSSLNAYDVIEEVLSEFKVLLFPPTVYHVWDNLTHTNYIKVDEAGEKGEEYLNLLISTRARIDRHLGLIQKDMPLYHPLPPTFA